MEITINGEPRQLVGNPPEVGDEFPHFKVLIRIMIRSRLGNYSGR